MISTVRHYAAIYANFLSTSFAEASTYRMHFVLLILMDLVFYASVLLTVSFLYEHVALIGSWEREDFLFFLSFMLAVDHLHMTFISENFWRFSADVRLGNLDFVLLRPTNPLFTIFLRNMRPGSLVLIPVPWALVIYYGIQAGLAPSAWLLLPLVLFFSFLFLVCFEVLISMGSLWLVESQGINFVRMQFQSVARWPDFVYLPLFRRIFTFIFPVLLIGSAPVKFLFNHQEWEGLVLMALLFFVEMLLIAILWRMGLRRYESASS